MITLQDSLRDAHFAIEAEFNDSANDIALAQKLEDFLNFVIYKKIPPSNEFDAILTQEIAEEIRKDTRLIHLFKSNEGVGKKGEEAFAKAIIKMVNLIQPNIITNTVTKSIEQAVIGNMSATVMAQTIGEEYTKELQKQLEKNKSIREYTSWSARQGKIDIDTSKIEITGNPTGLAKQLLNLTISVKNYSSFKVHLENVDRKKAYLAVMSEVYPDKTKIDLSNLENMWIQYQVRHINNDKHVEEHIQHLINLYALTGYGQVYINKTSAQLERKYAKFLMVNNRAEQNIRIRSTKEIVKNEILGSQSSGFIGRTTSKNKYSASYRV